MGLIFQGYVKRQAIYACLTCCPDAKTDPAKRAGVCLACSLNCHENHELVELYTKRNFRCDCGNPKFNSHPCTFTPNKTDLNYENRYNQNFSGIYCVCHRPYPDPEAIVEEEMIQCIICEDWLHCNHLEATVPHNDQYSEMVCKDCMEDNDFLHDYTDIVVNTVDKVIITVDPDLDVTSIMIDSIQGNLKKNKLSGNSDVDKDENVTDNGNSNIGEIKTDVDMSETKLESDDSDLTSKETSGDTDLTNKEQDTDKNGTVSSEETKTPAKASSSTISKQKEPIEQIAVETDLSDANKESTICEKLEEEKLLQDDTEVEKSDGQKDNTTTENMKSSVTDDPNEAISSSEVPVAKEAVVNESDLTAEKSNEIETLEIKKDYDVNTSPIENKTDNNGDAESLSKEIESDSKTQENKRKLSNEEEADSTTTKKPKLDSQKCSRPRGVKRLYNGATFWPSNFRQKLCTCSECISMYKDLAVLFLTDQDDTVTAYEALGKERIDGPASQYEKGLQALSSLDRVQQINALTEYNKMRDKLLDFLKSFKDRKEIVKEEDIKAFFAGMKTTREPDGVYFCR